MACKKLIGARQRGMSSVGAHQFEVDCSRACEHSTNISIIFPMWSCYNRIFDKIRFRLARSFIRKRIAVKVGESSLRNKECEVNFKFTSTMIKSYET